MKSSELPKNYKYDPGFDIKERIKSINFDDGFVVNDVVNDIILWKNARRAKLNTNVKSKLLQIKSIQSIYDVLGKNKQQVKEILTLLMKTKGVKLPMATTILHFFNENCFPIIDQRAYFIATNMDPQSKQLVTDTELPSKCNWDIDYGIETYFKYLEKCIEFSDCWNYTISVIDKHLYQTMKDYYPDRKLKDYRKMRK